MTCPHTPRLGAYALGVDEPERAAIDQHVAGCDVCRTELSELAEVTAALAMAKALGVIDLGRGVAGTPASAGAVRGRDDLLDRVLAAASAGEDRSLAAFETSAVRTPRRTWGRRVALLAAAAVTVAGTLTGVALVVQDPATPTPTVLAAGTSAYGVTGRTTVLAQEWGSRVEMALQGLPAVTSCRLVARAHDGRTETVASWRVTYDDALEVEGMSTIPTEDLAELQVIDNTGRRLLTVAATPTERTPQ